MHLFLGRSLLALSLFTAAVAAPAPEVQWHRLLTSWEVTGPFPKGTDPLAGLQTDYLNGEIAQSLPGSADWPKEDDKRRSSKGGEMSVVLSSKTAHVSYARTRFSSPRRQPAVLALGADDGVVAFLNGERVYQSTEISNIYLDHYRVPVTLREGENVLLLKVENWAGPSGAVARLLPPSATGAPTVEVHAADPVDSTGDAPLPTLRLEFLDASGAPLASARTDGFRLMSRRPQDFVHTGGWRWYGAVPPKTAKLRLVAEWSASADEKPVELHRAELAWPTREPIAFGGPVLSVAGTVQSSDGRGLGDAHFFDARNGQPLAAVVQPDGSFVLRGLRLAGDHRISVGAAGHLSATLNIRPPYLVPLNLTLQPGARSVQGLVRGAGGEPLANAIVTARGRNGRVVDSFETAADGRFTLSGLEQNTVRVSIAADADRFLPLDASLDLGSLEAEQGAPREFQLQMRPGATVLGTVRQTATGAPLGAVRLLSRENDEATPTTTESDRNGKFRLSGVVVGDAKVIALSPDHAPTSVQVRTNAVRDVQTAVRLSPGKPITGKIVDPEGRPLRGAVAYIRSWQGMPNLLQRTCRSDLQGRFEIPHMPDEPCVIEFLDFGFETVVREGLKGGDEITVVLSRKGSAGR